MTVELVQIKKLRVKKPILIEGFPGIGLVGTIAASYITDQRKMELVGYIKSSDFPPLAAIHEGTPVYPARVYQDPEKNLLVLFAEFVIPFQAVYDLADTVLGWMKKQGVKQIVSLAGMTSIGEQETTKGKKSQIYGIATTKKVAEYLKKHDVRVITEGATTGVSGIILAQCAAEEFPAMSMLAETQQNVPDPAAAAAIVEKISDLFNLKIDSKPLLKEAERIEKRMRGIVEQSEILNKKYEKLGAKRIERHGGMFG